MATPTLLRVLLLVLLLLLLARSPEGVAGAAGGGGGGNGTCPLDLSYVSTFPWDPTPCAGGTRNMTACCQTLLSVFSIGLAERLRATGHFRVPSAGASAACLADFAAAIAAPPVSLPGASLVPACFPEPDQFAASPSFCAGVTTAEQYAAVVGNESVTALDSACGPDLSPPALCLRCLNAGIAATARLIAAANATANATESQQNCFYLTVVYAAGVSSIAGPTSLSTANCTLGLGLSSPTAPPSKSHKAAIYATTIPIAFVLLVLLLAFLVWRKRRHTKSKKNNHKISGEGSEERRSHPRPNTGSTLFDIAELAKATEGFADGNLVGRGGFGAVYRGVLADGSMVAVKKMLDPDVEGGDEEFTNEVEIISHLRHRNLVPLRGCCIADEDVEEGKQRFLVYDFMPNGSLEEFIFRDGEGGSKRPALTWAQRRSIIMDVARGLEYLHYGVKPAIYHRDIKATNILLDGKMSARVADFGLARRSREGQSHLTTRVAGTHGYLAPEYALYGQLTEKSDVYSFGVLVLEILSARRVLDMTAPAGPVLITDWAWTLTKAGQAREVLDEALSTGESPRGGVMERFVLVGILCAHVMVALRPTITEAVKMLEGDMDIPELPDRPLPYGHGVMCSEAGSNLSASPAFSGPFMDNGDMLR